MRMGLVVDAACDLPKSYFDQKGIVIMPITIRVGTETFVDDRDVDATLEFYRRHMATGRAQDAETAPYTVEQIKELFLSRLVLQYDYVFCLTIGRTRSPIYENAQAASFGILNDYRPIRAQAGLSSPFMLRIIDSQNFLAGQGVTAVEAVRMIEAGAEPTRIRERLQFLASNTYAYMVPDDLYYARARGQKKGDRSVSWVSVTLATALDIKPVLRAHRGQTAPVARMRKFDQTASKLFDFVVGLISVGLLAPTVCLSYGGELERLQRVPGYDEFVETCRKRKIELFISLMAANGAVNAGEGALVIAFAAMPHELHL